MSIQCNAGASVSVLTLWGKDIEYVEQAIFSQHWLLVLWKVLTGLDLNWGQRSFSSSTDESGSKTR